MRLVTFEAHGSIGWGFRLGEQVVDMNRLGQPLGGSVAGLLALGPEALARAFEAARVAPAKALRLLAEVRLLAPIPEPGKIACIGLNYADHRAEAGAVERPAFPGLFHRVNTTLVGPGGALLRPKVSEQLDFEGELLVVIGRRCHDVQPEQALGFVAGYSIFNDASVRDVQVGKALAAGKNFDATGGFGPEIVTADELPAGASGLHLQTRLNGQVVQDSNTRHMLFGVAETVAMLSQIHTLEPGDLISTGTPAGVGGARKPPLWMKPGDIVEVEIEGLGTLRNSVADAV